MDEAKAAVAAWVEDAAQSRLPAWDALPAIPLYMDQVMLYLKDSLKLFELDESDSLLTSSMINNYVKNGVIPRPEKKKYAKEHLGALMAVCMLKQVLSLQEIKALLKDRELGEEPYELFREAHTRAMQEACAQLKESFSSGESLKLLALRLASEANAKRAAAERILFELSRETGEE